MSNTINVVVEIPGLPELVGAIQELVELNKPCMATVSLAADEVAETPNALEEQAAGLFKEITETVTEAVATIADAEPVEDETSEEASEVIAQDVTLADLRKLLMKKDSDAVRGLLDHFNAPKLSSLPEENFAEAYEMGQTLADK
ncbi:hypothetical protein [Culicoidibacter larvae]|uniref:Uncharacterized protein n=1 Tax=Culicoidibacter larvae TaxID=2579976 RepID=A0A5R8Q7R0_9FIRM|nr:hypothetical protein [Culicoidibacter larvae]TLG71398.1 hypothetical protein FEZ08_10920 [Culicoidibacter larvae]